jgi:hypothetical protein
MERKKDELIWLKNKYQRKQELSEDSNAQLFENLSQGCFIEYNNAYLYEYIKLSEKVQTL